MGQRNLALESLQGKSSHELLLMWEQRDQYPPATVDALRTVLDAFVDASRPTHLRAFDPWFGPSSIEDELATTGYREAIAADGRKREAFLKKTSGRSGSPEARTLALLGQEEYMRRWRRVLGGVRTLDMRSRNSLSEPVKFSMPVGKVDVEGIVAAIVFYFAALWIAADSGIGSAITGAAIDRQSVKDVLGFNAALFFVLRLARYFFGGMSLWGQTFSYQGITVWYRELKPSDFTGNGIFSGAVFLRSLLLMAIVPLGAAAPALWKAFTAPPSAGVIAAACECMRSFAV
jgi:hypothetical protein